MLEDDKITEESNQTVANETTKIPKVTESLATRSTESSASLLGRNLEEYAAVKEKFMDLVKAVNRQRSNPLDYGLDPSVISLTGRNFEKIEKLRKDAKRLTDRLFLSAPPALKSDSPYSTDSRNVSRTGMLRHWKRGVCSCSKERKRGTDLLISGKVKLFRCVSRFRGLSSKGTDHSSTGAGRFRQAEDYRCAV